MQKLLTAFLPGKYGLLLIVLFFSAGIVKAQTFKLTGQITDKADGKSLRGVTVAVKGRRTTTLTDTAGRFEIAVSPNETLQFSFVGYETAEMPVTSGLTDLRLALDPARGTMNEVVVTALGISRQKKSLGYSVQELRSKDISEATETNLVNALEGKVA